MDVTLPDGTVIHGVPDGITKADLAAKLKSNGYDVSKLDALPASAVQPRATDATNAVGTGFWRGMAGLAGLPADTAANVRDLAKAGVGSAYIATTGKAPPEWLQVGDRSKDIGSGANIIRAAQQTASGRLMLDPQNPSYEGGYLQQAGGAATGIMRPQTLGQLANQVILTQAGAAGSKAVKDATGSNALAITASMIPGAVQHYGTDAVKLAVRGGEAGRQVMNQRVQDLQNAGVSNPTLGLASGNALIGGVENLLQNTPGAVGIMRRNRDEAVSGLQNTTTQAADLASTNRGALESGRSIQAGAKTFRESFKAQQTALYDRLEKFISPQAQVEIPASQGTLATLNADIPTMPELSKQFKNSRIVAIENALKSDMSGSTGISSKSKDTTRAAIDANGVPYLIPGITSTRPIPATPERSSIPFEALKKTRTLVGNELADSNIISDVPRSKWNPLYGALSEDMQTAANAAGPDASNALNRANDYSRAGMARLDRIAPIVNRDAPEQSFTALNNTLRENVSTFQAVKKSLPQDARGDFAGTVIERLGTAKPGQQDSQGSRWSPETFLTNWNSMKPQARAELLSGIPNAEQVAGMVDSVAKATSMMRDNSKMWANPSGTAANAAARGTLGLIVGGGGAAAAGLLNPLIPLGAAAGVGGANLLARGVTSKSIRDAMGRQTTMDPELLNSLILSQIGARSTEQPRK